MIRKKRRTIRAESYLPRSTETRKDMLDEKKIRGPVLDAAMFLSRPARSHKGIRIRPPPKLTVPPKIPARNPLNIPYFILLSFILSLEFSKTYPKLYFY